jgi:hypothetical protein
VPDITDLILDDHDWFREQFARLDDLRAAATPDVFAVGRLWGPLGNRLDLHADAEERLFYPQLLREGEDDPEAETLDAIGDHNDIRDAVRDAAGEKTATPAWWEAVARGRRANDEHMAEEERDGLTDFRRHAPQRLREALGQGFIDYFERHTSSDTIDTSDKDPEAYVESVEQPGPSGSA